MMDERTLKVARAIAKVIASREAPKTDGGRQIDDLGRSIMINQMVESMAPMLSAEAAAAIKALEDA